MNTIYLFYVYYIISNTLITGYSEELVWYQGCYYSNNTIQKVEIENIVGTNLDLGTSWNETIVGCARNCHRERYLYFSTSVTESCHCLNESIETLEQVEDSFCRINLTDKRPNFLPYSHGEGYSAIYLSAGPYISHVTLTFDQTWIVVNTPVVLEITIVIPKLLNISSDTSEFWSPVQVSLNQASYPEQEHNETYTTCSNISETWTGDQLFTVIPEKENFFVRIPHMFTSVGEQNLVVRVWNELSTLVSEITVTVHQPEPRDLQIIIQTDEAYQPSCIPESIVLPENSTYFAVFVNAEFVIEASVANGNNLTFTYSTKIHDENVDESSDRPCDLTCDLGVGDGTVDCRDSYKKMVLGEVGVYLVTVLVENQHGSLSKTLYLVIIEERLGSLNFSLKSKTKLLLPWQPALFLVTMEVTSRLNTSLEVRFFKNHSHFATLEDSNSTSLSINCNQGEMSIVSNYGVGCDLDVQFKHDFNAEGTYNPAVIVTNNKNINITTMLLSNITVMNRLRGARLVSNRIVAVNQMTKILLTLTVSSVNMTVLWTVTNTLGYVVEIQTMADPFLLYSFKAIGVYHIQCNASNLIGNVSARTNVEVEEPVSGLVLSCGKESVVKTHQSVNCISQVKYGSDVDFSWRIFNKNGQVFGEILAENLTSLAAIIFEEPGKYNITVSASNSVSSMSISKLVTAEIPLAYVIILQKEPNMLGKKTDLKIITSESNNIQIEFDFGKGRVQHDYMYEKSNDAFYLEYLFDKAGIHNVKVFASNLVSEVVGFVEVVVERAIDKLEIMMYRAPVIGVPAIFILKTEGHIIRRKDLVFYWEFSDGVQRLSTNPVIYKQFGTTGIHNINFTAKNLVSQYKRSLQVEVDDRSPAERILLHDINVAIQEPVQLTLKGDNSMYDSIQISYGDGYVQAIEKNPAAEIGWSHIYKKSGLYTIDVELTRGDANVQHIESVISVEEPVSGLNLTGPSIVEIKGLSLHHVWKADVNSGTNMVYMWDFGGETFHTTHNKFVRGFHTPGTHVLKVTVINDISRMETNMTVIVQCPIVSVKLSATPVVFGKSTTINIDVTGGKAGFIHLDYGDGVTEAFSLEDDVVTMYTTEQGLSRYQITIEHEYQSIGSFEITTNISNLVSSKLQSNMSKVHEPIDGIMVTTDSPAVFPLGDKVTVIATVTSGQNLKFDWNFHGDESYMKPSIVSYGNTSTATHEFEFSGDYEVTVKVSNQLYKEPIVARLPFKFQAVEEIVDLTVIDLKNEGKAMLKGRKPDQTTDLITFTAVCDRGSHVTFIFHFGDGNTQIVQGAVNYIYMTSGEATHRYTEEGEYKVKVVAVNPLGNVTEYLSKPFFVQEPPMKPYLRSFYHIEHGQNFTFKVGEVEDKNITFDWKFGDLTDVVNSNKPEISHFYLKAGEYDLVVIANDRGTKTNTTAKVYVEHRIQGVTLNISSTVLDESKPVLLKADVFPRYINFDIKYTWKLGSQIVPIITDEPYVQHAYKPGRYTVAVTASNNVSSTTSSAVVLHLLQKIKLLEILMSGVPVLNATLRFKASSYRGSEMTFLWNFDDGSGIVHNNDSSQYIEHIFTQEGEYNVELQASNLISQARRRKQLFILNKICIAPKLTIHDSSYNKVNRSHGLQYEVDVVESVCEDTVIDLEYQWTIYNTSTNQPIELKHVYSLQQKRLLIKPCTLPVGFYKLEIKVQIKNSIVYSVETLEVEIMADPVIAFIKGGALREVDSHDDVVFVSSLSEDNGCGDHSDIRYNWTCSTSDDLTQSCLKDQKLENLTFDQPVFVIPTNSILPNIDLVIVILTIWKGDNKSWRTNQVIRIIDRPKSVKLSVYCPQCEKQAINANERLSLQAVCSNCSEDVLEYEWIIRFVFKSLKRIRVKERTLCTIKKPDNKDFNLWTLPAEPNNTMYTSDTDIDKNGSKIFEIHPSLLDNNPVRRKRQSLKNSSMSATNKGNTVDHTIPWFLPMSQGKTGSFGRRRQKSSRGSSRRTHYSRLDPLKAFPEYPWRNLIGIQGIPKQGNSSNSRINKDSQVKPGIKKGGLDKVYIQGEDKPLKRPKHILEKKTGIIFIRDDQTTTGTNKQSLVIQPGYFKQGFDYIIAAKAKLKDGRVGGTALTTFTVNTSPSKGVCEIMPDSGVELTTQFKLYCKEWKDKNKPLLYEVSFSYHKNGMKYVVYRGLRQGIEFSLPAGDVDNQYKVEVYISVLDDLLANTLVCRYPLEVRPISLESGQHLEDIVYNHTDLSNPQGGLLQAKRHGDDHQIRGVIQSLGRCLQRVITNSTYNVVTFRKALNKLIEELGQLSMRDELEVLQTVQSLESLVTVTKEFDMATLETLVNMVKQIEVKVQELKSLVINENLYTLLHTVTSSLIESLSQHHQYGSTKLRIQREYLENMIQIYHSLLKKEMTYHTNDEGEITKMSPFITTKAVRYTFHDRPALEINQSKIVLPENMEVVLKKTEFGHVDEDMFLPNQNCYQVQMTKFNFNPYMYDRMEVNKIQSEVCSLKILTCNGTQVDVKNLSNDNLVQIEVPRILDKNEMIGYHQLQKSVMNIHNFNVTYPDRNNSLNIEIDMVPVTEGRLFPIAVLINYNIPPTPSQYLTRHEINGNHLQIFLSSGYLNFTGEYFIGILDSGLNKGRPRQGEITQRNYTLKLWWNKCLFWNDTTRQWSDNGCWATEQSTYYKTHCICNHLTAFGSHFELIPNDLSHISVEDFFDLYENPVTVCLTGGILLLYVLLMVLCHKLDKHDVRKGGITYLIDNNLSDKQKYEVTVETGFRKGAGTTAKISVILHGEEGMSETRELISDDDAPLFERNSRDKFIMTLPDSIGRIWKVQLWHNNFGSSPSWYLSRVIVKDLNIGSTYYFISEKWLAVEEDDGKVEREFMALEGNLGFRKVFWAKGTQYLSDYHIWMSLLTCPSYSQFNRKQRLTCCLTLLMTYMCLNAMWYKENNPEYRGEFGLLDVSLRSITVGAICCAVVIPVNLLIILLFRRSKMQQSGDQNEPIPDEEKEDEQFASGKPNEHAHEEEEVESVQPIMTYSILDQSILNWPSIQDWAQKQWVKRHQGYQDTSNSADMSHIPNQMVHQRILGSEIDQASSGFEDSNSTDPRRQITISSQNSSQKMKAPSISSGHRPSNSCSRKTVRSHLYLPYWCQFVAWFLCSVIIGTCAVITIMYGFRFGKCKSIMWLQSLYFSFMVCVFITQPFMIIIAVIYTAIRYKNDPSILDHYEEGEFGEKAKLEILRRKKEQIQYTEQEELERGVAARQRSRYLRFARPPQEKQLIEARKKIMKEKKAMSLLRDTAVISLLFVMLCVMAYGKDTSSPFYINEALKNSLIRSGPVKFNSIKFGSEWYNWSQTTLLDVMYPPTGQMDVKQGHQTLGNSIIIGQVQLRQLKVIREDCYCPYDLPFLPDDCFHDYSSASQMTANDNLTEYVEATSSINIFGRHGIYDNSGYVLKLNRTRSIVQGQLEELQTVEWINNQTRAVIVEFTLYNAPTNLFTSVVILLEFPSSGGAYPDQRIRSTHLYRYVSPLDNLVLAFELMFIILTVYKIGVQLCNAVKMEKYFHNFWVVIDTIFSALSLMYIIFYIYRFILVSETVENLRSTYFQQFVDVSFLAFWDEIIRCLVGMILFLVMIKFLRLLHYNKIFSLFATVYRRLQREMVVFMGLFLGSVLIFSRIGHVLFGSFLLSFHDIISSILTVSSLLTGIYEDYPMPDSTILHTMRIFILFFSVFATGLLTSYMVAILSYRFRIQKHKHSVFLVMKPRETILFYWQTFLLWTGIHSAPVDEEPVNILPPEFTMAEVEYQVDELFFRINTLTGSHGLPEKPTTYFTDSDGTYGLGDDGISSGGSEVNLEDDDRLENRVHKIEDSLCSHEPYIAQLLMNGVNKGREKQIRSHLEMEIFRQLQNQRNSQPPKTGEENSKSSVTTSGSSSEMATPFGDRKSGDDTKKPAMGVSSLQHHTFIHHAEVTPMTESKLSPYQARRSTTSSSSNPDSPDEIVKNIERVRLLKEKGGKKLSTKPDDISQSTDSSKSQLSKIIKKPEPPHKPTFHNPGLRDVQNQDFNKSSILNSPALRQLRSSLQAIERDRHSFKGESGSSVTNESSSGSEQDAIHGKAYTQSQLKRNLRKTKSRGKGKGSVNLTSVLLDDLDTSNDELGATGTTFKISETEPILEQEIVEDYFD